MIESMRRLGLVCALAAATLAGGMLAAPAGASERRESIQVDGKPRTYSVHVPDTPAPAEGFPLVLAFHGGGMQGEQMRKLTHLDGVADRRGFVVVYPDGIDKHWNDGRSTIKNPQNDVGFVSAMIGQLKQHHAIDRTRVYATGISNGALFTERLACDLSRDIAAIAPVAGTLPSDIASECRPEGTVAVLQIGGTADPIMPFGGGAVAHFGSHGEGGQVLSVLQTSAFWAQRNSCAMQGTPEELALIAPADPTRVVRMLYTKCPASGPVVQLSILRGGHTWPGGPQYARPVFVRLASRQIDASESIADFFLALPPKE